MKVAVVGAGRIGGGIGRRLGRNGHEVTFSFSRDARKLEALAAWVEGGRAGTALEAVEFANQFGVGPEEIPPGLSAVEHNGRRMPGAAPAKAFNTLTAGFQAEVAAGTPGEVAMFYAAEDEAAGRIAGVLVAACGFAPVRIGGWQQVGLIEAPRRPGAVYGEAYRPAAAERIAAAARTGDLEAAGRLADELKQAEGER
ncbi:MAG: NAD(P)-binding domain-containing protein [Actinobacteria bacterium]|nr:NAD(P)-binding domain-containing protein [Actinomycetota bacterium]